MRAGDSRSGDELPWGARALKVIRDYDTLFAEGASREEAIQKLRERTGVYDPELLQVLADVQGVVADSSNYERAAVEVSDLRAGMLLDEGIETLKGGLIVPPGQTITPVLLDRLRNYQKGVGLREPIMILIEQEAEVQQS